MCFMAKNQVFLAIPLPGTHLHLHFDGENHSDGRNNDLFGSAVPPCKQKIEVNREMGILFVKYGLGPFIFTKVSVAE